MRAQGGQTLVIFGLLLTLFLTGMIALVADVGSVMVAYNRADDAALLAAQSGASAIDPNAFRAGGLQLDPDLAQARCTDSLARSALSGACQVTAQSVTATVQSAVALPIPLAGFSSVVRTQRSAIPVFGGSTARA